MLIHPNHFTTNFDKLWRVFPFVAQSTGFCGNLSICAELLVRGLDDIRIGVCIRAARGARSRHRTVCIHLLTIPTKLQFSLVFLQTPDIRYCRQWIFNIQSNVFSSNCFTWNFGWRVLLHIFTDHPLVHRLILALSRLHGSAAIFMINSTIRSYLDTFFYYHLLHMLAKTHTHTHIHGYMLGVRGLN